MPDDLSDLEREFEDELRAQQSAKARVDVVNTTWSEQQEQGCARCTHARGEHWNYYGGLSGCEGCEREGDPDRPCEAFVEPDTTVTIDSVKHLTEVLQRIRSEARDGAEVNIAVEVREGRSTVVRYSVTHSEKPAPPREWAQAIALRPPWYIRLWRWLRG